MCRLTAFCIKLTYIAILQYRRAADEVAVEICDLWIFFVRGMQVILFYNVVYVYVCKIGEVKFGVWWRSFFVVGSIQPSRLASAMRLWLSQRVNWATVSVLVDSKGNKKTAYWYCLSLNCCYKRMRNSVAYCCRDFVVNRRKAPLGSLLWQLNQHTTLWPNTFPKCR